MDLFSFPWHCVGEGKGRRKRLFSTLGSLWVSQELRACDVIYCVRLPKLRKETGEGEEGLSVGREEDASEVVGFNVEARARGGSAFSPGTLEVEGRTGVSREEPLEGIPEDEDALLVVGTHFNDDSTS